MKRFLGKKAVLLGALVVALGVAIYLNYFLADNPTQPIGGGVSVQQSAGDKTLGEAINVNAGVTSSSGYFVNARNSREQSRAEAVETVKELLNDVKATDEQKQMATAEAIAITKAIEQENSIETLIKAKGYADCVVYIADGSCSVVVQCDNLTTQDTAKISQIVTSQADISAQNINIVTVK